MDFVAPGGGTSFIAPMQTDAAYPARIGEPSVDGPIVYPEPQPNEPNNVVPFQRETGIDPSKIPSLSEITKKALDKPNLRVLAGNGIGSAAAISAAPVMPAMNPAGPASTQEVLLAAAPEQAPATLPWWGIALAVVAAGVIGYAMAPKGDNEPLVADMGDDENEDEDEG